MSLFLSLKFIHKNQDNDRYTNLFCSRPWNNPRKYGSWYLDIYKRFYKCYKCSHWEIRNSKQRVSVTMLEVSLSSFKIYLQWSKTPLGTRICSRPWNNPRQYRSCWCLDISECLYECYKCSHSEIRNSKQLVSVTTQHVLIFSNIVSSWTNSNEAKLYSMAFWHVFTGAHIKNYEQNNLGEEMKSD